MQETMTRSQRKPRLPPKPTPQPGRVPTPSPQNEYPLHEPCWCLGCGQGPCECKDDWSGLLLIAVLVLVGVLAIWKAGV